MTKITETLLIIDTSGSMADDDFLPNRLRGAIDAGVAFVLEKQKSLPQARIGVIGFSDEVTLVLEPKTVGRSSTKIIDSLRNLSVEGWTDYSAGLEKASSIFNFGERSPVTTLLSEVGLFSPAKKQIVFLSDGHNGGDDPLPLCQKMISQGVHISCIGVGGNPSDVDEDLLKSMASSDGHGGVCYRFIKDTRSLITEFKKMANIQIL